MRSSVSWRSCAAIRISSTLGKKSIGDWLTGRFRDWDTDEHGKRGKEKNREDTLLLAIIEEKSAFSAFIRVQNL
jgi:hypothetical protein